VRVLAPSGRAGPVWVAAPAYGVSR
jgi:hypothetical protein